MTGFTHAVVINEPPSKDAWGEALRASAEHHAPIIVAATMIDRHGRTGDYRWLREVVEATGSPWVQHVVALSPEAVPHRPAAEVEDQIALCPPWQRNQRIYAGWEQVTVDRWLQAWDESQLYADDALPTRPLSVRLAWDYGEGPGRQYGLLAYVDEWTHEAWCVDEVSSTGRTTTEADALAAIHMLRRHNLTLGHVSRAVGDVNSAGKESMTSVNVEMQQALARLDPTGASLVVCAATKGPGSVEFGATVLNRALAGHRLHVSPRCVRLLDAIRGWRGGQAGRDKAFTHPIDAARYGLVDVLDLREVSWSGAFDRAGGTGYSPVISDLDGWT